MRLSASTVAGVAALLSVIVLLPPQDADSRRETVVRFVESEMVPHDARWRAQHHVDRELWRKAGETGLLLRRFATGPRHG